MTTTIAPSSGQGILFAQQGPGTTPGYSALDDRRSNSGSIQEGVYGTSTLITAGGVSNVGSADFMVTQRGAGANMSVDVNMPAGGFAWVQGDTINGQGLYGVPVHASTINEVIAAADATNPRIDQVILEIQDNVLDASGGNQARTRVLTGTPTSGATLSNRSGAAALPGSALLLADVLVPNGSSTVPNANIRDRRKWARGAFVRIVRNNGTDYTTGLTTPGGIDPTNINPRIELSGVPIRAMLQCTGSNNTAGSGVDVDLNIDGTNAGLRIEGTSATAGARFPLDAPFSYIPTAGSHLVAPTFCAVTSGTATIYSSGNFPVSWVVEEVVRQSTANNAVTSG